MVVKKRREVYERRGSEKETNPTVYPELRKNCARLLLRQVGGDC
jgi:hypothetical protein